MSGNRTTYRQPTRVITRPIPQHVRDAIRNEVTAELTQIIAARDVARQAAEDARAMHRNRNRLVMLLMTWVLSFVVPTAFKMMGGIGATMMPYAFTIPLTFDSLLTIYATRKRY